MFKTVDQITAKVIYELGLATGASVQTYTEPQIVNNIEMAFEHLSKKRFWEHLTLTSTHDLDETGMLTSDLIGVAEINDIMWVRFAPYTKYDDLVYYRNDEHTEGQPAGYEMIPYGAALQQERLIKVVPAGLFSTIKVRARRTPTFTNIAATVPFDWLTLVHFVTANILANDGMNPSAQQRHDAFFTQRYNDLVTSESRGVMQYTQRRSNSFTVAPE